MVTAGSRYSGGSVKFNRENRLPLVPMMRPSHRATFRPAWLPAALAMGCLAASAWGATQAALPEPVLRLSTTLSAPHPASSADRSLLRLEWQSARSTADESEEVALLIRRLDRMNDTVEELRRLIAAQSVPPSNHPPATIATVPDSTESGDALPWPVWLACAGTLAAMGVAWTRRRTAPPEHAGIPMLREPAPPNTSAQEPATAALHQPTADPHSIHPKGAEAHLEPRAFDPNATLINPLAQVALAPQAAPGSVPDTAQSLELAEIMLSMGLADGAVEALTEHIRVHPRQALYHWLKLLDVYRVTGKREEFQQTANELRQSFNVQAADWGCHTGHLSIEDYPHIAAGILNNWRKPGNADYLKGLLEDNRGGTRAGFPEGVAEEILLLLALLKDD